MACVGLSVEALAPDSMTSLHFLTEVGLHLAWKVLASLQPRLLGALLDQDCLEAWGMHDQEEMRWNWILECKSVHHD